MSAQRRKRNSWLVIGILTGTIVAYLYFVFFPGMGNVRSLTADIATKRAFLAGDAALASRLRAAEAEEAATRAYVEKWSGAAVKPGDAARLYAALADCMKSAGVATTVFRPEPKQNFAVYERLPLTVACSGSFQQLQALLAAIEQLPQRIWIEEATFEREKDGARMRCELKPAIFVNNFEISD